MEQSIWELMNHGYGAMWVVVAFSVIALAVGIERFVVLWDFIARARLLADQVRRGLLRGAVEESRSACERSSSPLADVFLVGYERSGRVTPEHVATAVHRERLRVNQDLRTRLWMLGTIGATAPFVGLFGTVVGIMSAMSGFRSDETLKIDRVAGPISQALIVTAVGILVAVESVILYNYFNQRSARIATEMKLLTDEFLEMLVTPIAPEKAAPAPAPTTTKGGGDGDRNAA